jgi:hypothetical protein
LTAVWFHLDQDQRQCGIPRVAALVKPEGLMMLSLRHSPVPPRRRMCEVTLAETIALVPRQRLHPAL